MRSFSSVEEILDFAVSKEEEAAEFYSGLANQMERPAMRDVFKEFANEERRHKAKLQEIKRDKLLAPAAQKVMNLKIAEQLSDVKPSSDLDYQQALTLAMKREKASFKLYSDLASATEDEALRNTMLALAQEEAKHKLRLEVEYDDYVLGSRSY